MLNVDEVLNEPLTCLKGVGPKLGLAYLKLGIRTCFDLLCHFPKNYCDCSKLIAFKNAENGQKCCIKAKIIKKMVVAKKNRLVVFRFVVVDESGCSFNLVLFNNEFLFKKLELNQTCVFFGKIEKTLFVNQMVLTRVISNFEPGLIPTYGLTTGLSSFVVAGHVRQILKLVKVSENLPHNVMKEFGLVDRHTAFYNVHFAKTVESLIVARKRLIFEELFIWQLSLRILKYRQIKHTSVKLKITQLSEFFEFLPFSLTSSQLEVINQCVTDCLKNVAMNRLVQGDVGCGKTVIAQALCFLFVKSGYQVAVMAPTEILANQHFKNFKNLFDNFKIKVGLLTGSLKKCETSEVLSNIQTGETSIVVGTHSLFSKNVAFKNLGLVVTDEQHRFGVLQRSKLIAKGMLPHVLVMSATPVPRTLAFVLFADMDISIVKQRPKGRAKIKTVHIPAAKRRRAFGYIASEVKKGRQAYIVCPLIDEGKKSAVSLITYFEKLQQIDELKSAKLAMLHGKQTSDQKKILMEQFAKGEIDVLVATSVVEVGIDNANATVILIENAELFGLASLHQLRGRVGRGQHSSICVLVSSSNSFQAQQRMKAMCRTSDGFKIANFDLKLRGPGQFFGTMQHGLPKFKIANLDNLQLVKICALQAQQFLNFAETFDDGKKTIDLVESSFKIENIVL